jgi:hypothetical protein
MLISGYACGTSTKRTKEPKAKAARASAMPRASFASGEFEPAWVFGRDDPYSWGFNERLDPATVHAGTVRIRDIGQNPSLDIPVTRELSEDGRTITRSPPTASRARSPSSTSRTRPAVSRASTSRTSAFSPRSGVRSP